VRTSKEISDEIRVLEHKLNKLIRRTSKVILLTNSYKVQIIDMKDKIQKLYDELKIISEKEKITNE